MFVPMELSRVLILDSSAEQFITLTEKSPANGEPRSFAIKIGTAEAVAIERRLQGLEPPRPQTHDLLDSVIRTLGGELAKVAIHRLDEGTYFASLHVRQGGELHEIDARPSDAIALCIKHRTPVEVAEDVLEASADERPDVEPPIEAGEDDDDD
jgi:bifunctional DNase/RNase